MTNINKGIDQSTGIRYMSLGNGPKTMVIIPGLSVGYVTDSAEAVAGAFAEFKEDFTVYLFDIREEVPENYPISQMGEDLVSAIKNIGLSQIHLYGCSMGGMQAMYIAGTYPELVAKLVVVSSACKENDTAKNVISNWLDLAKKQNGVELMTDMGKRIYSPAVYEASKETFVMMAQSLTPDVINRFINTASGIANLDVTNEAKAIKCPMLVMGSNGDQVLTGKASQEIASITGAEIYMYDENTSHAIYDEVPEVRMRSKEFFLK